jgi:hypothetical protein
LKRQDTSPPFFSQDSLAAAVTVFQKSNADSVNFEGRRNALVSQPDCQRPRECHASQPHSIQYRRWFRPSEPSSRFFRIWRWILELFHSVSSQRKTEVSKLTISRPSYQAAAVEAYLADHNELPYYIANADATNIGANGGVYNRAGRGYPDVAANGAFLTTYNNLTLLTFFGTSLASPIFGSVLTLINEERTAVGKGPVGFVNPTLYARKCYLSSVFTSGRITHLLADPYVLNDITNGSNPNCGKHFLIPFVQSMPVMKY